MSAPQRSVAIGGLVLAAGEGRRFGSLKQLARLDGRPLLEHALLAMSAATLLDRTVVVLGAHADEVLAGIETHGVRAVICAGWEEGQAASLRAGLAALGAGVGVDAVVVTLGDQPRIAARAIDRVIAARVPSQHDAVRASYGGRPGHPVLLERPLIERAAQLRGDEGARNLLAGTTVALAPCDGLGDDRDVDTVEGLRLSAGGSSSPC